MPLDAPINVDFVVTSPYGGNLSWENSGEYMFIELWEKKGVGDYEFKWFFDGSKTSEYIGGLDPSTNYCFALKGIGPPQREEESELSDGACKDTYAVLQAPTDIVTTVFSNFIEITWKDNSADEDAFCIDRHTVAGDWVVDFAVIDANVEYWRDTTVAVGVAYTYKVRARQNPTNYSGYVTGVAVTANNVPNDPTGADITGVTDEEMRVIWVAPVTGYEVTGYKIQISDEDTFEGEETEYVVADDVLTFLFKGLTPSQRYWVRVYSYNGVGDSTSFSAHDDTCLAVYVRTEFEVFVRDPNVEPIYIAEIDMKMTLSGFTNTSGNVYEVLIDERGLEIDATWRDGVGLDDSPDSIASVEALENSYWWNTSVRKLYVHVTGGLDPDGVFFMEGGFTHLIPSKNFTYADTLCTLPPWLSTSSIPGTTQEIKSYYEGSYRLSTGSISFANALSEGEYYFDKRFETFTWIGAKLSIYVGKDSFSTLAQFKKMFSAYISNKEINDAKITFSLGDVREGLERNLVLNTYSQTEYPGMEEDFEGEEKLKAWGYLTGIPPVPIGTYDEDEKTSAKFHFHDGRSWGVEKVTLNGVTKTKGTDYAAPGDYYVDLRRSIVVFDRDLEVGEDDIVLINFTGRVNSANEPIGTYNPVSGESPEYVSGPAEVFKNILNVEGALPTSELNTDWIYETKYAKKKSVSVPLYKNTNFNEIIKTIEHSSESYILQDGDGRIGLRSLQTTVPSKAKYIWNFQSKGHTHRKERGSLYWKVKVYYAESVEIQGKWVLAEAQDDNIRTKFGVETELSVYCYFESETTAQALATAILALLNKVNISDELPMILFDVVPGDLVPFSRTRFFDSTGADELALRILRIEKNPQTGKTTVKMEKAA